MVEIPENMHCLYSGTVTQVDDEYVIEVPATEIDTGAVSSSDTVCVAILPQRESATPTSPQSSQSAAPVSEGEQREVTIVDVGSEGDGIAFLGRGYILFVPDTEPEETVFVEVVRVMQRFAVAAVLDDEE